MLFVHYNQAEQALLQYVEEYNHRQDSVATMIRQPMVATAWRLIKIYGAFLVKANGVQPIDQEDLPPLATNNKQLTYKAQYCLRTVQRHLKRLLQAGIITRKVWHGSKASYEVWINPKVLGIDVEERFQLPKAASKAPSKRGQKRSNRTGFREGTTKSLHTDTSNTGNNNTIREVDNSTDPLKPSREQWCSLPLTDVYGASSEAGNRGMRRSLPLTGLNGASSVTGNKTGNLGKEFAHSPDDLGKELRASPSVVQDRLGIEPEDPDRSRSLSFYVDSLWSVAQNSLYRDQWLSARMIDQAKRLIRKWYEPVANGALGRVHQQYIERIALVRKYVAKAPNHRFVQLPHLFFNPYHPSGLAGTKQWYKDHQARKEELRVHLILDKQIRKYLNNLKRDIPKQRPVLEVLRECEARLGKLQRPELVEQFHAAILKPKAFHSMNTMKS